MRGSRRPGRTPPNPVRTRRGVGGLGVGGWESVPLLLETDPAEDEVVVLPPGLGRAVSLLTPGTVTLEVAGEGCVTVSGPFVEVVGARGVISTSQGGPCRLEVASVPEVLEVDGLPHPLPSCPGGLERNVGAGSVLDEGSGASLESVDLDEGREVSADTDVAEDVVPDSRPGLPHGSNVDGITMGDDG